MTRKHVAFLAAISLVSGMLPAHAEPLNHLINVQQGKAQDMDETPPPPPPPPPKQKQSKVKQGKGTKGDKQQYMTVKMQDVYVSGRAAPQRPNSALSGGLLDNSGGFNQNGPASAGTPLAPTGGRGGGQVIK